MTTWTETTAANSTFTEVSDGGQAYCVSDYVDRDYCFTDDWAETATAATPTWTSP